MKGIIGIIPARGGSKGIPLKNMKNLAGKPLIAWTIDAALKSHVLDRVIVSTDHREIARIAKDWGAEVPFIRPEELATDTSTSLDVIEHAMDWLQREEKKCPEYVLLLQPTSPLRTENDICGVIDLMRTRNVPAVVSVCEAVNHPYLIKKISNNGTLEDFIESKPHYTRRQDYAKVFVLNGSLYLNRWDVLKKEKSFTPNGTLAYVMPQERSIDIDTPWDFFLAEQVLLRNEQEKIHFSCKNSEEGSKSPFL